jgi:hypothetical protein
MAKKTKELKKAKKVTNKGKKTFGKPVDVTGVAGGRMSVTGCGCMGMPQDPASFR